MLSRKNITKLLNPDKRRSVLVRMTPSRKQEMKTAEYAEYVVEEQIKNRKWELKDDKSSAWGFPPIGFLCAVRRDGSVKSVMFEMNVVNHFLKEEDASAAHEVVEAVLLMWKAEDKDVAGFDPAVIDEYLSVVEKAYEESRNGEDPA